MTFVHKRTGPRILAAVCALAALFAVDSRADLDLEIDELTFGFIKLTDMAPLAVAYEKGFFEDEGLYVTLEPQANWKVLLDRVITGEPPADRIFYTPSKKAQFVATRPMPPASLPGEDFPFVMLTGRIRDQWHTMARTGQSPKLSQAKPEPFVEIHSRDAIERGLANGSLARIESAVGAMRARVVWSDDVRRGEIFVPIHFTGELASAGRVGPLIAAAVDPHSGQPELKATPVALWPLQPAWHAFVLSRELLRLDASSPDSRRLEASDYAVRARGPGYWRYELAGDEAVADWPVWARCRLGADGEWVELCDAGAGRYRGARLIEGRLDACVFVSATTRLPDRNWLGQLFERSALRESERMSLLAGRPAGGVALAGPIICACHGVGCDAILQAITSGEATSVNAIGRLLQAGTCCGSCIPELNALLVAQGDEVTGAAKAAQSEAVAS